MSASSVQTIISDLNKYHDLQRSSRFYMYIPGEDGFPYLRCESVDMPGRALDSFEHRTYGPFVKYPKQSTFGEVTAHFFGSSNLADKNNTNNGEPLNETGLSEKRYFENWMQKINPYPQTSESGRAYPGLISFLDYPYHNFAYKDTYVRDIMIVCYDSSVVAPELPVPNRKSFVMVLKRSYPTAISSIELNWGSEDVVRFTVSFTYDWFTYSRMHIPQAISEMNFDMSTQGEKQIANRSIFESIYDLFR
jgi:hypothetical protein